jgi:hypothetical protein
MGSWWSSLDRLIILTLIVVPLISLSFVLLQQLEQVRAQTNNTSINPTITNNTSINPTITNNTSINPTITNNTYTNITYGVSMRYPVDWTLNTTTGNFLVKSLSQNKSSRQNDPSLNALHFLAYFYPKTGGIGNDTVAPTVVNLAVLDNVQNISSPKAYVDKVVTEQKANDPKFQSESSSTAIGNYTAEKLVYDSKDNQNRAIKSMNIITLKDNKFILLTYSSSPINNERYLPDMENMTKSLIIS